MNGIGRRSTPGGGTVGQCTRDSNIARHCETVRYSPTGNPGEYAPYQARFLHRPEKVTRSDAPPTPGEPNHNEPYRKPRTGAYRRIAAHSRYVIPCHRGSETAGRSPLKRTSANHTETPNRRRATRPARNISQHSRTPPPGIRGILPVVPPQTGVYAADAYRPGSDEWQQCTGNKAVSRGARESVT
jgi:hypothetical protein